MKNKDVINWKNKFNYVVFFNIVNNIKKTYTCILKRATYF